MAVMTMPAKNTCDRPEDVAPAGSGAGLGTAIAKTAADRATIIRRLNDALRIGTSKGHVMMTAGIAALPLEQRHAIMRKVRSFDAFTPDNDPYGEHDYGSFVEAGHVVVWKIDAYDIDMQFGSPDAADPAVTARVLTIMLAEEY